MQEAVARQSVEVANDTITQNGIKSEPSPIPNTPENCQETKENQEYITGLKLWAVVVCITLAVFLLLLDISIIGTAIPSITSEFHSLTDVGWYGGAYQLANATLQPLTGKLFTHFSAKWTFLAFFFVFEIGSLICGLASSSAMFIIGRTIGGLGGSGLMNGGLTVISGAVPLEKRPLHTGMMLGVGQLGLLLGPIIGGSLTQYVSWRWCFYINLPIGAVCALLLTFTYIPELTVKSPFSLTSLRQLLPELDLLGFALFAPAAVMFLLALQLANEYHWNSSVIIGLLCGSGVTMILFIIWEMRMGMRAMIPGPVMRQRVVLSSFLQSGFLLATTVVISNYLPIYFQAVLGVGPTMSGVYTLPSVVSQLIVVVTSGALISRLGYYLPWAVAGSAVAAIGNGLMSTISPTTDPSKWIGFQILMGAGRGAAMQTGMIATQNTLPPAQIPVSMAILIFSQNFFGAVFLVIGTTIFSQSLSSDIPILAPSVSPAAASSAGGSASAVRALVPPNSPELPGLLLAYSNGIDRVFYLIAACGVAGHIATWGLGRKNIRRSKKTSAKGDA